MKISIVTLSVPSLCCECHGELTAEAKEEAMNIITQLVLAIALLLAGFAAGFPIGKNSGFATGSEWAFVQADILARESGLSMPVSYEEGQFRVIVKQPRNLYKRAWQLADRQEDSIQSANMTERSLSEHIRLVRNTRNIYPTQ